MNNDYIYLSGKCKWAKLVTPDTKFNIWSIVLYPDPTSYDLILKYKEGKPGVEGILNVIKKDEDGYFVTLKRPTSKLIKGKLVPFSPPEVLEPNGEMPLRNALIGNGSDVTCKCEVYFYKKPIGNTKGSAIRLMSVRVDNLVPFEMRRDFTDDQEKLVRGLPDQPKPSF